MLSLDDARWLELGHRNWSPGQRPGDDPGVPFVPEELRRLLSDPADFGRFTDLWPALPEALSLITEQMATAQSLMDTRYYLAATAALKGFPELGELLNNLEASLECQACGETIVVLPDGLV